MNVIIHLEYVKLAYLHPLSFYCFLSLNNQPKCHLTETQSARERHANTNKTQETVTFTWHLLWNYIMNCNFIRETTAVSDLNQYDVCYFWESLFVRKNVLLILNYPRWPQNATSPLSTDFQHISLRSTKASIWSANLWVDDIHMRGKTKSDLRVRWKFL